jgi:predicted AAA+ superfamily ATPase
MEIFNQGPVNKNTSNSIIKNGNKYKHETTGVLVARLIMTQPDTLNLISGVYTPELISLLNGNISNNYFEFVDSKHYSRWEPNNYQVSVYKNQNINELGYGVFELNFSHHEGNYFQDFTSSVEASTIIDNKSLAEEVFAFFENTKDTGRKNKKGFLLYGPPGNGKTTKIMSLFPFAKEKKMRIIIVSKKVDLSDLNDLKVLLENEPTIFIFEELTQRTNSEGTEELLTFLDGENSWNNSVVIATTNHPEDLPRNLVDRPGRFDSFIEYSNPDVNDINALAEKYGFSPDDSVCLTKQDLSFDYISFIMSQAKIMNILIKDALVIEKEKKQKISKTFKTGMGI